MMPHLTVEGQSYVEVETELNDDQERIHRWLVANKLTLNVKKCEYMIIGSRYQLSSIDDLRL